MDIIWATPLKVIDQQTAAVAVTHEAVRNDYEYGERVRIRALKPSTGSAVTGFATTEEAARLLLGRRVRLHVLDVEDDGLLLADACFSPEDARRGRAGGCNGHRAG